MAMPSKGTCSNALIEGPIGPGKVEWTLPPNPELLSEVRDKVRKTLERWGIGEEGIEAVLLVITEIICNVIRHVEGNDPIPFTLSLVEGTVEVRVQDSSSDPPVRRESDTDSEGGRGLFFMDLFGTVCWTILSDKPGKIIIWTLGTGK